MSVDTKMLEVPESWDICQEKGRLGVEPAHQTRVLRSAGSKGLKSALTLDLERQNLGVALLGFG